MKNSFIFLETIENKFTIGYLVPFQRPSSHIWIQMRHQRTTLRTVPLRLIFGYIQMRRTTIQSSTTSFSTNLETNLNKQLKYK